MEITKEKVEKWLDDIIQKKNICKAADRNVKIESNAEVVLCESVSDWIHIHRGIEKLAEALGETLIRKTGVKYDNLSFKYRGVEVVQVIDKEEGQTE